MAPAISTFERVYFEEYSMKRSLVVVSTLSLLFSAPAGADVVNGAREVIDGAQIVGNNLKKAAEAGAQKVADKADWIVETTVDWHKRQIHRFPIREEEVSVQQALKELSPQVAEGLAAVACVVVGSKLRGAQVPVELKPGNTLAERTEFAGRVVDDHMRALEAKLNAMEIDDVRKVSATETIHFPINEYIAMREADAAAAGGKQAAAGYRQTAAVANARRMELQREIADLDKAPPPSGPAAQGARASALEKLKNEASTLETQEKGLERSAQSAIEERPDADSARKTYRAATATHAKVAGKFTIEAI
jgi:hypothetical protein